MRETSAALDHTTRSAVMSSVALIEEKSRIYLTGNTFPIREQIKNLGGHWDGERRAWWVGKGKREAIAALANSAVPQSTHDEMGERKSEAMADDTRLLARVRTERGAAYLLARTH